MIPNKVELYFSLKPVVDNCNMYLISAQQCPVPESHWNQKDLHTRERPQANYLMLTLMPNACRCTNSGPQYPIRYLLIAHTANPNTSTPHTHLLTHRGTMSGMDNIPPFNKHTRSKEKKRKTCKKREIMRTIKRLKDEGSCKR